jgi:hypothetical protein
MKIGTMAGDKIYGLKSLADSLRQRKAKRRRRTQRHRPQRMNALAFFTCEEVPRQTVSSAMMQFVAKPCASTSR